MSRKRFTDGKRGNGGTGSGKNILKARDKVLTKMTKDGAVEQNVTAGEETRISKRDVGYNLRRGADENANGDIAGGSVNDTPFGENIYGNTTNASNPNVSNPYGDISDTSNVTSAVKSDDTPIKSSNQANGSSSSQVGIRLNRHDTANADGATSKQKSARIRRKQELSNKQESSNKQEISKDIDKNDTSTEIVQTPSAQTTQMIKNSDNNVIPFQPHKPSPMQSKAAVYDFPDVENNSDSQPSETTSTGLDASTDGRINHDITRSSKLKTSPIDGYEPKGKLTHKSKTPTPFSEHRLSKVRQTPKSRKFAVVPPTDKTDGAGVRGDGITDTTQARHSKRRKPYQSSNSQVETSTPQAADEIVNPSKLRFTDDEAENPAVTNNVDSDEILQNPDDQDVPTPKDIPPHKPRSPTASGSGGSTATVPTSSRSKKIRHKRQSDNLTHDTKGVDAGSGTDKLDVSPITTPLSEKPTPPRSRQPRQGQSPQQRQSQRQQQPDATGSASSGSGATGTTNTANNSSTDTPKPSPKISKLEHRVTATSNKLNKAKNNLPDKHKIRVERSFDENSGKVSTRLRFDKEVKSQSEHLKGSLPIRPVKFGVNAAIAKAHMKIYQVEHENVGTQAAHKVELAGEAVVRSALRHIKLAPYKKVAKLERKLSQRSARLAYRRAVESTPRLKKNPLARLWQKRKIKRQHAKALRQAQKAASKAKKAGSLTARATKAITMFIKKNPKVIIVVIVLFLVINIFSSLIGMLSSVGSSGAGAIFATTYLSEELEIEAVSLVYNRWEMDLTMEILNVEENHPGFDEYRFNTGDISHNPFELIAYLTATRFIFTLEDVEAELRALFDEQYQLSFTPSVEVRYRDSGAVDAYDNPIYEPFDWHVMTVTLIARNFTDIIFNLMTSDQRIHFDLLMQTRGQRQIVGNPFEFSWRSFITSEYGYRIHPITGVRNLHRGIDIGVPTGTEILAGFDGVVTFASYNGGYGNIVIIQGNNGLEARYAHMDTISVRVGQDVDMGDVIGTVGSTGSSTGPHLHMEVLRNGQFLNPIFFVSTGDFALMPSYGVPNAPMGDETFQQLWVEIYRALGRPYVWGASGPNAFDCSGFIFHVFNQSGVLSIPRTTAQGYYNMSTRIPRSELRPGDLVFFQGTFSTYRTVTHVGIYVGNGNMMAHAGTPVQIASFETPFWTRHFYGFGRLH